MLINIHICNFHFFLSLLHLEFLAQPPLSAISLVVSHKIGSELIG
jgi:hypothetical protein